MKNLLTTLINFVRFLYQTVHLAAEQIWANRMRSALTMLGIIIGVASVTATIAALSGFRAKSSLRSRETSAQIGFLSHQSVQPVVLYSMWVNGRYVFKPTTLMDYWSTVLQ